MNHENENINRKMQYILNMRPVLNKNALLAMEPDITETRKNQKPGKK